MCSSSKPKAPPPPQPVQPVQAPVTIDTKRRNQAGSPGFASVQNGTLLTGPRGAGAATTGRTLLG